MISFRLCFTFVGCLRSSLISIRRDHDRLGSVRGSIDRLCGLISSSATEIVAPLHLLFMIVIVRDTRGTAVRRRRYVEAWAAALLRCFAHEVLMMKVLASMSVVVVRSSDMFSGDTMQPSSLMRWAHPSA